MRLARKRVLVEWSLLSLNGLEVKIPIFLDAMSRCFGLTVRLISLRVLMFSTSYMSGEKHFIRFHLLVVLFVLRIFFLIFRPRLISLLLGWDGLGVTSYLLVIYFNSNKSYNAGFITALTNRVGDCLLLIAIGLYLGRFSFNFYTWSSEIGLPLSLKWFTLAFLLATITKRAQIPFSAWLPAAIAAPTPVSALVHSSTLVTAGVYLLIRFGLILGRLKKIIFILGLLTIIIAGLSALWETDIKKIVALSTLSQLGLIITAVGIGVFQLAFFHLLSHAFFKALLFITVGNFIHLRRNNQDLRFIALPLEKIRITLSFRLVANMSLIGLPFLRGFYSKDLIIENSLFQRIRAVEAFLIIGSIGLTVIYTFRFLFFVVWGSLKTRRLTWIQDRDLKIEKGIATLWPLAIFGGAWLAWRLIVSPAFFVLPSLLKYLIILVIGLFSVLSLIVNRDLTRKQGAITRWSLGSIWSLPIISGRIRGQSFIIGSLVYRKLDLKWNLYPVFLPSSGAKDFDKVHGPMSGIGEGFLVFSIIFLLLLIY